MTGENMTLPDESEAELRKKLLLASDAAAKASALRMGLVQFLGKRSVIWKNHHDGTFTFYRIAKWRGKQYLLSAMTVSF